MLFRIASNDCLSGIIPLNNKLFKLLIPSPMVGAALDIIVFSGKNLLIPLADIAIGVAIIPCKNYVYFDWFLY